MMSWLKPILDIFKWIVSLTPSQKVTALFSIIITFLLYENYSQKTEHDRLVSEHTTYIKRMDSVRAIDAKRVEDCEAEKFKMVSETSAVWAKKFEEIQKQVYEDYRKVTEVKKRR